MRCISKNRGGHSSIGSSVRPNNNAQTGSHKDSATNTCLPALIGTPIDSYDPSCLNSKKGTSKHGFTEHCTAKRAPPPRPVLCVTSRRRPNMSCGYANGTKTSSTNHYHQNGWSASRALTKNLCGRKAGFHSNPKTTCTTTTHTMDMAFGRTFNPSDPTSMQA